MRPAGRGPARPRLRKQRPFAARRAPPAAPQGDAVWRRRKYRVRRGEAPGTFYYS